MFCKCIISVNALLRTRILKYVNNIEEICLRKCVIFLFSICIIKYFNILIII